MKDNILIINGAESSDELTEYKDKLDLAEKYYLASIVILIKKDQRSIIVKNTNKENYKVEFINLLD